MKTYKVKLQSKASTSFYCTKAAQSLDIDVKKKLTHNLEITADLETDFNVGLILGSSGSGKTTLAKKIFSDEVFNLSLDEEAPIIDQFGDEYDYEERQKILSGVGLTSVVTWLRPVKTLSNGQRARAEAALFMSQDRPIVVIDEWTSVVDRTVAKVMSHCVQKLARKFNKKVILLSCHYDVTEWLLPDFVIDCNTQTYQERRSLRPARQEKLKFTIKEVDRSTWKNFSKYHYLSERLPGGSIFCYGIFEGDNQIGFQCFANYVPHRDKSQPMIYHSNRTVIHPDYAGLGIGIKVIDATSFLVAKKGFRVMAKFSSTPIYRSMSANDNWLLKDVSRPLKSRAGSTSNKDFMRLKVKMYSFEFIGEHKKKRSKA